MFKKENILGFLFGAILYAVISLIFYLLGIHSLGIKIVFVVVIAVIVDYIMKRKRNK